MDADVTGPSSDVSSALDASASARPSIHPPAPMGRALLIGVGLLFGAATLGAALAPWLAVHHPLVLIALNPWPRHVILVAPHTPMVPLVLIASLRGLFSCVVTYEVGRHYGPQGIQLFERRSPRLAGFVRAFERMFSRAAPVFLVLSPGPLTSTLAAVSGNSRWLTWTLSWIGFVIWASVNYQLGDWLKPWTAPIMAFIQRHLLVTTLACAAIVFGYQWIARQRRLRKLR